MTRRLLLILFIFIFYSNSLWSKTDENDQFAFAESLFAQNDYYRAITEYKRFLFNFPKSSLVPQAKFKIAKSYQLGDKCTLASDLFYDISREYKNDPMALDSEFEMTECLYLSQDYISAEDGYRKFIDTKGYERFKDISIYRIGLSNLHLKETERAKESFRSIKEPSPLYTLSSEMAEKTSEFEKLKRKNPLLAGILSAMIPGTGQFYNGRIKDGIIALLTNGLFIWGTYECYRREYYSLAVVTSVFSFGWYAGNIFGAVNGAHRHNFEKEKVFYESLKPKYENPVY